MVVVVGLMIAFVLVAIFSDRKRRLCRWRRDSRLDQGAVYWKCLGCGKVIYTDQGAEPQVCFLQDGREQNGTS